MATNAQINDTVSDVTHKKAQVLLALLGKIEGYVEKAGPDATTNQKLHSLVTSYAILASETPQNPAAARG